MVDNLRAQTRSDNGGLADDGAKGGEYSAAKQYIQIRSGW
jgi:hypothetical protein